MALGWTGVVNIPSLNVYDSFDADGSSGTLYKGEVLTISESRYGMYHHNFGWSTSAYITITNYGQNEPDKLSQEDMEKVNTDVVDKNAATFSEGLGYYTEEELAKENTAENDIDTALKSSRGIFGMPYQYMDTVDMRVGNSDFGYEFSKNIVSNIPLLLLTPGKPLFLKGFTKGDRNSVLKSLVNNDENTLNLLLNQKSGGKFYSFQFNYIDYYNLINPLLRKLAILMKIGDEILDGKALSDYDWQYYTSTSLSGIISAKDTIPFYIDADSQVSEDFNNDTTTSQLAGAVNGMSDMGREMQFLLGTSGAGDKFDMLKQENYQASLDKLNSFADKFSKILPDGLMDKLSSGLMTVVTGGKMVFPGIWADSEFSTSYNVKLKFTTPDCDPYSVYMNIFAPLLHLIGLVGAQQMGANGYKSPFLVRAYYKGHFNINMGIITSMSVSKGDKCRWTLNGLPTVIEVDLSIKDLYNTFSLANEGNIVDSISNTAELDYLSNLAGININKVDISRTIDIYYASIKQGLIDNIYRNKFMSVEQGISNLANRMFGRT